MGTAVSGKHNLNHNWTYTSPCFTSPDLEDDEICVFTDLNFAQGRGISVVTSPKRANVITSKRAFRDPEFTRGVNQDLVRTIPAVYEIKELPGKGLGVLATRLIRRGELIMANTASVMADVKSEEGLSEAKFQAMVSAAAESLPAAHRNAVMRLSIHNANTLTDAEIASKVMAINAYSVDDPRDDVADPVKFSTIFPELSRINHACRPNTAYFFDWETMAQYVYAVVDIPPGEELSVTYIDGIVSREERLEKLHVTWGFECSCAQCTLESPQARASDTRIKQIKALVDRLESPGRGNPGMAELLISLYKQEKLWGSLYEGYTFAAIEYNRVDDPWRAMKNAQLAIEHGIPVGGENLTDVVEMRSLAENPWEHWSWNLAA
ncbi:hypothetical protein B0H16DRAFT_1329854 [Mycena metata]|uniref:SET domain-containing protein n=1 Tax=Mycena metata TaxID=1033252 RepID=A0AAD7HZG1_9AGAR|nr:hypothetical protein B0H16DRAFT_1329854 [Mycena metata]